MTIDINQKNIKKLGDIEEIFKLLFYSMTEITVFHELVFNEHGEAVNYRIIDCNPAFIENTGIKREGAVGKLATEVYGVNDAPYLSEYAAVALTGKSYRFNTYYPPMDKHFDISVVSIGKNMFATISRNVTEIKKNEEKIKRLLESEQSLNEELKVSEEEINASLEESQALNEELKAGEEEIKKNFEEINSLYGKVKESEEKHRRLFETMSPGVVYQAADGTIISANPSAERMLGLSVDQMTGKTSTDPRWKMIYEDGSSVPGTEHPTMVALRTGEKFGPVTRGIYIPEKDEYLWLSITAIPLFEPGKDGPHQAYATFDDITEKKKAEQSLKESQEKYYTLFNQSTEGIYLHDTEGRIIDVNDVVCELSGYSRDEWLGLTVFDGHPDKSTKNLPMDDILRIWNQLLPGQRLTFEAEHQRKDSTVYPVEISTGMVRYGNRNAIMAIVKDITERKLSEEALRESEIKYRTIVDNINDALYIHDFQGRIIDCNEVAVSMTGYSRNEMIGNSLSIIDSDENKRLLPERMEILLRKNKILFEGTHVRKDGSSVPVEISGKVVTREGEGIIQGFVRDITERKISEEQQIKNYNFQKIISEISSTLVKFTDKNFNTAIDDVLKQMGEFFSVDRSYLFLFSEDNKFMTNSNEWCNDGVLPEKDELKNLCIDTFPWWTKKIFNNEFISISDVNSMPEEAHSESKILKNQKIKSVLVVPVTGHNRVWGYIGFDYVSKYYQWNENEINNLIILSNIIGDFLGRLHYEELINRIEQSLKKEKEEKEMLEKTKIESITHLAGGIAHDFNNILNVIFGNITLAKLYLDGNGKAKENLEKSEKGITNAKNLTAKLLSFSKGGMPVKKYFSLNNLIAEISEFMVSGSNVDINFELDEKLYHIYADYSQISQAIQNIIINSEQAMTDGGTITIKTENITPEIIRKEKIDGLKNNDYVRLTISDEGKGIPPEIINNLFEPYVTTKGAGSGLGLSIVRNVIENHDGKIKLITERDVGATFQLYIPAEMDCKCCGGLEISDETPEFVKGKGRVLVLEDDLMMQELTGEILEMLGYEVDLTSRGEETLEKYNSTLQNPYEFVIIDLVIKGGMGGKETMEKLLEMDKNVKAIVASGYSEDNVMANYRDYGFSACLKKPYSINELSSALKSVSGGKNDIK